MGLIDEQIAGFSESELGEFRDSMPWELTCESQSGHAESVLNLLT